MSQTTTAATPEDCVKAAIREWLAAGRLAAILDNPALLEREIAAMIRQHSEAQRAEIERLKEALDDVQTAYCNHVMQQTDANVIAQSVADYGSAEAAVKGLHDFQLRVHRTMIDHFKARATTAEAALAAVTAERGASLEREREMREALEEAKQDIRRVRDGIAFVGRSNNATAAIRKIDAALQPQETADER